MPHLRRPTRAQALTLGVLALLENPAELAVIRDATDPGVIANAVEELLRYLSIIQNGQRRIALAKLHDDLARIAAGGGDRL